MTILSYKELMEPAFLLCILLSFFLLPTTAIATTNLTYLVISGVTINVSDISEVLGPMKSLHSLTITHTNLSGFLPKHWPSNLSNIDLSDNNLTGEIPTSVGNMLLLHNLSLASNNLSGPIPDSISALSELVHLDLSSNQLNGTVPKFISELKNLKYLNLENNKLHGVMSFNESFIKKMSVFKISGNNDLCYDQTTVSSKLKLGIPPCDKHELTIRKLLVKDSTNDQSDNRSKNCDNNDDDKKKQQEFYNQIVHDHKGPKKVVLGVAIGLSCTIFFIILLVILSKWRG